MLGSEESLLKLLLFFEPLLAPSDCFLKLDHFVGDNFALLQGFSFEYEFIEGEPGAV